MRTRIPCLLAVLALVAVGLDADEDLRREMLRRVDQAESNLNNARREYSLRRAAAGLREGDGLPALDDKARGIVERARRVAEGRRPNDAYQLTNLLDNIAGGFWQLTNPLQQLDNYRNNDIPATHPYLLAYRHALLRQHQEARERFLKMLENPERGMQHDYGMQRQAEIFAALMQAEETRHNWREEVRRNDAHPAELREAFEAVVDRLAACLITDLRKLELGTTPEAIGEPQVRTNFLWQYYRHLSDSANEQHFRQGLEQDAVGRKLYDAYVATRRREKVALDAWAERCCDPEQVITWQVIQEDQGRANELNSLKNSLQNSIYSYQNLRSSFTSFKEDWEAGLDLPAQLKEAEAGLEKRLDTALARLPTEGDPPTELVNEVTAEINALDGEMDALRDELRLETRIARQLKQLKQVAKEKDREAELARVDKAVAHARQAFAEHRAIQLRQRRIQEELQRLQREQQGLYEQQNKLYQRQENAQQHMWNTLEKMEKLLRRPAGDPLPAEDPLPADEDEGDAGAMRLPGARFQVRGGGRLRVHVAAPVVRQLELAVEDPVEEEVEVELPAVPELDVEVEDVPPAEDPGEAPAPAPGK